MLASIALPLLFALPPFVGQVAPGVWAGGYPDKRGSANAVWYEAGGEIVVIGAADLAAIAAHTGKPARARRGGDAGVSEPVPGALFLERSGVLFAGDLIANGPHAQPLADTRQWIANLDRLRALPVKAVVPGRGSWGGPELIDRQRRYAAELRRQIAYGIAMERPLASLQREFALPAAYYVWMPYDTPNAADIAAVHAELTAPQAPFHGRTLAPDRKHALVLLGDRYHEPEHLEEGLRPAFEATGVVPHFTYDVRALTAANLARVDLLVILRDGMVWPAGPDGPIRIWMTTEQEIAVRDFVHGGKAFLNLHNSMGLYPAGGEYLKLSGGRYIGHGPLERFHVEVSDPQHPVAQGLQAWFAADEQHTPPSDIPVRVFLRSRSADGTVQANAGWTHEPGKGRVCHLAPGHTREALGHPMFQRALGSAIQWCLRAK